MNVSNFSALTVMRKLAVPRSLSGSGSCSARHCPASCASQHLRVSKNICALPNQPQIRCLAQVRSDPLSDLWFTPSRPSRIPSSGPLCAPQQGKDDDHTPPDERTLKLGKTLRILSPLLPTILTQPLPSEILSPDITLHLFPSTHPHLPAVKGRVAYRAALWTAPVAWGSVPIWGNVRLEIRSEKVMRTGHSHLSRGSQLSGISAEGEERLVVRWRTEAKEGPVKPTSPSSHTSNSSSHNPAHRPPSLHSNPGLSTILSGTRPIIPSSSSTTPSNTSFSGLFIFTFDAEARIRSHTIEHADESSGSDRTSRVVELADWLIGRAKRVGGGVREGEWEPGLAFWDAGGFRGGGKEKGEGTGVV